MPRSFIIILFMLLVYCNDCSGQDGVPKTYIYGVYTVKMNYCKDNSSLEILRDNKQLYYTCSGDAQIYFVDTLSLNDDDIPDFIIASMDEYIILDMMVSSTKNTYKHIGIIDIFTADLYSNMTLLPDEKFQDFAIADIDKDGKKDIITNIVIDAKGKFRPSDITDTFLNSELRKRAKDNIPPMN